MLQWDSHVRPIDSTKLIYTLQLGLSWHIPKQPKDLGDKKISRPKITTSLHKKFNCISLVIEFHLATILSYLNPLVFSQVITKRNGNLVSFSSIVREKTFPSVGKLSSMAGMQGYFGVSIDQHWTKSGGISFDPN